MADMLIKYFWFMFVKKEVGVYMPHEEDEFFPSSSATKRMLDNSYLEESAVRQ